MSTKTIFVCQECGKESQKWLGRCPACQQWNSFVEKTVGAVSSPSIHRSPLTASPPQELCHVTSEGEERFPFPMPEFNRVLGGGLVPGSLLLISGDPGIGKSTLLLQISAIITGAQGRVVYASGEETARQIKLRAERLGIRGEKLFILSESDLGVILEQAEELSPSMLVVDSIQAVYLPEVESAPGSVTQVRECAMKLMQWAKSSGVSTFITGHVTKEGSIAGPRVLEHIVDAVLYLEGEQFSSYRLLRSVKNRFGSTNEVGVFEMKKQGMVEVENPSEVFLAQRGSETVGSIVVPVLEGSRPLLVEVQALTNLTIFGTPRRTGNGIDFGRLLLVTAVLSKRAGLRLGNQDVMVNVAGGLKIGEPAADLGVALAIASSFRDAPIDPGTAAVGEIGLSGELRGAPQLERRINEVARMGFTRCLIPRRFARVNPVPKGIELVPVSTIREAIRVGLSPAAASTSEED